MHLFSKCLLSTIVWHSVKHLGNSHPDRRYSCRKEVYILLREQVLLRSSTTIKEKSGFDKEHIRIGECAWLVEQWCEITICKIVGLRDLISCYPCPYSHWYPPTKLHQAPLRLGWARVQYIGSLPLGARGQCIKYLWEPMCY